MTAPGATETGIPETGGDAALLSRAAGELAAGRRLVLATVLQTWGSAPRPAGSHLLVFGDMNFTGSVSGGCIEGDVLAHAGDVLSSGRPEHLEYGISNSDAWEVGLACGGTIHVWLERLSGAETFLSPLMEAAGKKLPACRVLDLGSGKDWLATPDHIPEDLPAKAGDILSRVIAQDRARLLEEDGKSLFLRPYNPPARLVIVGAVHITAALVPMARTLGLAVEIVDPRGAFRDSQGFDRNMLSDDWPDDYLEKYPPDARTAVITLTHDPKLDDAALEKALRSDAFYIGCLGSKKTHSARIKRLQAKGFNEDEISRIHAPLGLPLGGRAAPEIALSALAQLVSVLRGGNP